MKKALIILLLVLVFMTTSTAVFAAYVRCPYHPQASCFDTGQVRHLPSGETVHLYRCTCGDKYWVTD